MTTILPRLIVGLIVFLAWTPVANAWSWPVQGPVLQTFSYDAAHPYAAGQHRGIDIGADAAGETVAAPAAGTVSFAGTVPTSGKSVTIDTADGYSITLTHLGSILVAKGAAIGEQDAIGTIGPSGTAEVDGPYVHLGIRVAADPNGYVDPLGLLPSTSTESGTDSGSATSQPSSGSSAAPASAPSSGAGATSTPTTEPAPAVPAGPPATHTQGSTVAKQNRVSRHAHKARADVPVRQSSQRPAVQGRIREPRQAGMPKHHVGVPKSSRRPVVETAAPAEPTGLDAGHEIHSSVPVAARPAPPRPAPTVLVPLLLTGAAAVVAVAAALAAARSRRRRRPSAIVTSQVIHLPQPADEHRPVSRAA